MPEVSVPMADVSHSPLWLPESLAIAEAVWTGQHPIEVHVGPHACGDREYVERIAQLRRDYSVIAFAPASPAVYAPGQATLLADAEDHRGGSGGDQPCRQRGADRGPQGLLRRPRPLRRAHPETELQGVRLPGSGGRWAPQGRARGCPVGPVRPVVPGTNRRLPEEQAPRQENGKADRSRHGAQHSEGHASIRAMAPSN